MASGIEADVVYSHLTSTVTMGSYIWSIGLWGTTGTTSGSDVSTTSTTTVYEGKITSIG